MASHPLSDSVVRDSVVSFLKSGDREQAEDFFLAALVEDELPADLRAEMEFDGR